MTIPAPASAREVVGTALLVGGPEPGVVRWTGWSEIWLNAAGDRFAAFRRCRRSATCAVRRPSDLWVKTIKDSFRPVSA